MQLPTTAAALLAIAALSPLTSANPLPEPEALEPRASTVWAFSMHPDTTCSQNAIYTKAGNTTTACVNLSSAQQGASVKFGSSNKNIGGAFYVGADCKGKGYALPYNFQGCKQAQTDSGFATKFLSYTIFGSA